MTAAFDRKEAQRGVVEIRSRLAGATYYFLRQGFDWDPEDGKTWDERYAARARGEKIPPKRELTADEWREALGRLLRARRDLDDLIGHVTEAGDRAVIRENR
jgi:hypothetical protein